MNRLEELAHRFEHHPPHDAATVQRHKVVRSRLLWVAVDLDDYLPESREKSLFLTHLEEAMMWANAAIARYPEARIPAGRPVTDSPQA
jgi:hypothetical protein